MSSTPGNSTGWPRFSGIPSRRSSPITDQGAPDTQFTEEEIAAAVREASARGTYVTVHAHNNAGIRNAVAAGVKCVEHGTEIDEETAALMAANQVAHVPTLLTVEKLADDTRTAGLPTEIASRLGNVMQGQIDALLASRAAGIRVGSGSDLLGSRQSGRGRELTLRAQVETPLLALKSATGVNAEILGISDDTGTIEVGKAADLAGFSADPLENPDAFGDPGAVALVIQRGRVVKDLR